ncbi:DNA replication protein [Lactiplantibacillus modestisalitolerans]|uniref:DNA replication protein n=1 Tax=Lactiplantibacillus modestisalitolerans TaxID=1457219 RepID=A0ABV5WQU7_9LACO|nr:DNA replication protein [Lactiplantibacillus modestisalitolerans]
MPLTMTEFKVLSILPRGAGYPMTTSNICKVTQLKVRDVRAAVSVLISQYGVPIVANRNGRNMGMFIATNQDELNVGIAAFKSQVATMNARIRAVEQANIDEWEKTLRPDIQRLTDDIQRTQGA